MMTCKESVTSNDFAPESEKNGIAHCFIESRASVMCPV